MGGLGASTREPARLGESSTPAGPGAWGVLQGTCSAGILGANPTDTHGPRPCERVCAQHWPSSGLMRSGGEGQSPGQQVPGMAPGRLGAHRAGFQHAAEQMKPMKQMKQMRMESGAVVCLGLALGGQASPTCICRRSCSRTAAATCLLTFQDRVYTRQN